MTTAAQTSGGCPKAASVTCRSVRTRWQSGTLQWSAFGVARVRCPPHTLNERVLQDPLPRYLLADEVGLGKTIEAGAILRQWKLDHPSFDVIVLAPEPLVSQWRRELGTRFGLREEDGAVRILSHDSAPLIIDTAPHVVVIDEAHRVTAGHSDPASIAATRLARGAERLLLISANPPLANEQAFLGLLALIDPDVYGQEDIASFRKRIEQRQEYGRLLLALRPDASSFVLRQRANGVRAAFPDDFLALALAGRLLEAENEQERARLCVALRDHIADTYRIHHRIVRSRRSDCPNWVFGSRGPRVGADEEGETKYVRIDADEDARSSDLLLALEDWRLAACVTIGPNSSKVEQRRLAKRFRALLEALGRGAEELGAHIRELEPGFTGEKALLSEMDDIVRRTIPGRSRFDTAVDATAMTLAAIVREGARTPKLVAFTTERATADKLARMLAERLGGKRVLSASAVSSVDVPIAERFAEDQEANVLVLDRSGEEGLNLHFAHALMHYDLPFSIERLEQRIGRLDRFGRTHSAIRHRIIVPSDDEGSPWTAWVELLNKGFGIFSRSVSDVQLLLGDLEQEFELGLLRSGAAGLAKLVDQIRKRIEDERQILDEQYVLDQIALTSEPGERLAEALDDAEADEEKLGASVDEWLFGVLQFRRYRAAEDGGPSSISRTDVENA
jgi:ATP-dependent helicase HepA